MFEQEVNIVRELVDEIRKNLPTTWKIDDNKYFTIFTQSTKKKGL